GSDRDRARPAHAAVARGQRRRLRQRGGRMRLQLISAALVTVAAVAAPAGSARAQSDFSAKLQVYTDDDHTTVVSPVVHASAEVGDNDTVTLGYLADVVTSASIDVVSQASATTIHDVRHQVSASEAHIFGAWTAT